MSRKKATLETLHQQTTAMMGGEFNEGAICLLLPMLTEIALSLAVIADRMEGRKEGDGNETN